jgi:hypothetical protein
MELLRAIRGSMTNYTQFQTITNDQVNAATDKTWDEWVAILDVSGARYLDTLTVAIHLKRHYRLNGLWARIVAQYYAWKLTQRDDNQLART